MIISHTHKFIFAKSCKTAGTSIEVFLSAYCKKGDVLTRIGERTAEWHEALSSNSKIHGEGYYNHVGVATIRSLCPEFKEYYKFTAIRHPLDRMLSLYHWQKPNEDFNKWIKHGVTLGKAAHLDTFYKIKGRIVMDDYIRYERLEEDLKRICGILGLEYDAKYLLHYKKREREPIEITEDTKQLIRRKFKQELIDFGYEMD